MTTDSPPWKRLKAPPLAFASSGVVLGGLNNNFILVVGGAILDPVSQNKVLGEQTLLEYDITKDEWKRKSMSNAPELNWRVQFDMLSDNNEKSYLHGGNDGTFLGDTYLFDTLSITWTRLATPQVPILACDFSSVLLNDGRLIIIGGYGPPENNVSVHRPISQIEIYNTINNTWSRQIVPQPKGMTDHRRYHTSTLLPNGDVVIVGGLDVTPNVVILETAKDPFQWRIPDISELAAPPINEHCAELVQDRYIFIMFGKRNDVKNSNKLYILDTKQYSWITSFQPNKSLITPNIPILPDSPNTSPPSINVKAPVSSIIVVLSVVISILTLGLLGTLVFLYKRRKNQSGKITTLVENKMSRYRGSYVEHTNIMVYPNEDSSHRP
ncbi:3533_t:CDS:2, partial [Funneliformis caledonium]